MLMNKECVVLFPVYRSLDASEVKVIEQAIKMTKGFNQKFIAPQSFLPDDTFNNFSDIEVIRFDDRFFENTRTYNWLMLNLEFYEKFADYKYILIHQTDAYLFKEELKLWCDKDYDYIGAPWYDSQRLLYYYICQFLFKYGSPFFSKEKRLHFGRFNNVGNGGLSLRKVESFIYVLKHVRQDLLDQYLLNDSDSFNEDMFWSLEASSVKKDFRIPKWREAMAFSLEEHPNRLYKKLNYTLPFGCHAFNRIKAEFWKDHIPFDFNQK